MQQLFQKTFVSKRREVQNPPQLIKNRYRHAPLHPLPRHVRQIPTPAQKSFHDLNLRVSQTVQTRRKTHGLERTTQRRIAHRTRKHLRKRRRLRFTFTHHDRSRHHSTDALIAIRRKDRYQTDRVERYGHHVERTKQVPHRRFPKRDRPAVFTQHAQFHPALARRLPAPNPLEEREVTREDQKHDHDHRGEHPLRRTRDPVAPTSEVRDDQSGKRNHEQDEQLNRVIDRAREKAIPD